MIGIAIKKRIITYKGVQNLQVDQSFHLHAVTRISGPSGAGKTTLLRIIAGLVEPEEGRIAVNGQVWLDTGLKINLPPQQRNVGFVFQDYALFPNMTVEQHLRYGTRDESYISRLISLGQLDAFRTQKPEYLSGGQQQRLAILRALSTRPKLMLMDEPFSALNRSLMEDIMQELKILFNEIELTCLIVSHQQESVDLFFDYSYSLEGRN